MAQLPDKYELYENAVQDAPEDVRFFAKLSKRLLGREAYRLREDFCGTFWMGYEWASLSPKHFALGIDNDSEPVAWGKKKRANYGVEGRVSTLKQDVRDKVPGLYDLALALNFSYCIFKVRAEMLDYCKAVRKSLAPGGLFMLDHFGGPELYDTPIEKRDCRIPKGPKYKYIWEQKNYSLLTNFASYRIHFKIKNGKKISNAFSYDWRLWSLAELQDLLLEAGFKDVSFYFEDDQGDYKKRKDVFDDDSIWIAYIVATK